MVGSRANLEAEDAHCNAVESLLTLGCVEIDVLPILTEPL
jgi:hypothetical protein